MGIQAEPLFLGLVNTHSQRLGPDSGVVGRREGPNDERIMVGYWDGIFRRGGQRMEGLS